MLEGSIPLIAGTVLALAALSFVLLPLLSAADERTPTPAPRDTTGNAPLRPDAGLALDALREIEFDRETGKLSDSDYDELKTKYTAQALADMRKDDARAAQSASPEGVMIGAAAGQAPAVDDDAVEAAIRAAREGRLVCASCGPRPEGEATYCSDCGRYLPVTCGGCGAAVTEPGARFCVECGTQLAAA